MRPGSFGCDEVLLIGDSNTYSGINTDGSAGYNPGIDITNNSCLEFRNASPQTGKFWTQVCQDQLQYNFSVPAGSIGCALTFLRDYYKVNKLASHRNVRVTACGVGGTGLVAGGYWAAPSGGGLTNAVSRFNQAIANDSRNTPVCIIWNTGANDAINGVTQADYLSAFEASAVYLRSNITNGTNLPILVVGLVPAWVLTDNTQFGPVNLALQSIPTNVSKTGYVNMTNLDGLGTAATGQTAIPYHLNAASQRLIGNPGLGTAWTNLSA
jgi:hypothetical protein